MQTVTFTCGHCGNLMAVGTDLLGKQVRCPHCQQVIEAVVSTSPSPPPPVFQQPAPLSVPFSSRNEDEESIFAPKELHDDIFGDPKPPKIEIPADPTWNEPVQPPPVVPSRSDSRAAEPASLPFGSEPAIEQSAPVQLVDETAILPPTAQWSMTTAETQNETNLAKSSTAKARRPAARPTSERGLTAASVLIFLVPYAIFMTFVAIYFYSQSRKNVSPLEMFPDVPAERPGVTKKGAQATNTIYNRWSVDTPLPAKLQVPLRESIQIGALEVTPERVERGPIEFRYDPPRRKPQRSGRESLVLTLRLKNTSTDQSFYPTDCAFDAHWDKGPKPYTFLEVGSQRFYGGPIVWPAEQPIREYIKGQERDDQPLGPGEQRTTVICTDPGQGEVIAALAKHAGQCMWRVRLRRGLVTVRDREVSASAVIGVQFATSDIQKMVQ
jgi:hypothetical protein